MSTARARAPGADLKVRGHAANGCARDRQGKDRDGTARLVSNVGGGPDNDDVTSAAGAVRADIEGSDHTGRKMDDQHLAIIRRRRVSDDCVGGSNEQPDGGRTCSAQGDGTSHFGGGEIQDADGDVGLVGDVGNVGSVERYRTSSSLPFDSDSAASFRSIQSPVSKFLKVRCLVCRLVRRRVFDGLRKLRKCSRYLAVSLEQSPSQACKPSEVPIRSHPFASLFYSERSKPCVLCQISCCVGFPAQIAVDSPVSCSRSNLTAVRLAKQQIRKSKKVGRWGRLQIDARIGADSHHRGQDLGCHGIEGGSINDAVEPCPIPVVVR